MGPSFAADYMVSVCERVRPCQCGQIARAIQIYNSELPTLQRALSRAIADEKYQYPK
jgi:hypothetical protein